ncbi:uncharacterized protein PV07_09312 [Cladophialophora immunda]|uniref:Uncharacterized protein n=1 Tax=Cladophialophora immunda TaxID=569365 RepID=A0A0D2C4T7_9EURO|nr:uncharacterized protein PV07_09312 [Cladophialophora immunda]KIW26198.1 hypothetical protein PV07_09312 [Cladophialophora immunda]
MAQQKSNSHKVEDQSQPDSDLNIDSAQRLTSEMAKAFQELEQAETTAAALEVKLDGIHKQLDELLASFEELPQSKPQNPSSNPSESK